MAEHAHSTTVPVMSNPDKSTLNRRTALLAMPALSGLALLAATARASPVFDIDQAIERLNTAMSALEACEAESWRLDDALASFASVVIGKSHLGEEIHAYSEHEIQNFMGKAAEFWGPGSAPQQRLDAKIAEFREAREARLKAERDSGLTECLDRLGAICIEYDAAFDALIGLTPTTLNEARRKMAALAEPLGRRMLDCDSDEAAEILRSLV